MIRFGLSLLLAAAMTVGMAPLAPVAEAQARKPLLIDGKNELFERVLTRPGAKIAEGVGAPGEKALDPFTPLYVYQRYPVDGTDIIYLEVGPDARGTVSGFLPETETVPWRHALVLAFSERVNRERTLFFREKATLEEWLNADDLLVRADDARKAIDGGNIEAGGPIVSVEPEALIDFEKNFYMLPILSAETKRLKNRRKVRMVEIASVTREEKPTEQPMIRRINPKALDDFRAGIVFVIDASSSMGPYIKRTREVMDSVLKKIEAAGLTDKVRFGLVAYRDDPDEVEGIEFLAKTFADPNKIVSATDFAAATAPLAPSSVSTRAFAEDAFAAIEKGLEEISWDEFGARYMVLITDASARTASVESVGGRDVPPSKTGLSVDAMRERVRGQNIAFYTFHLQSPVGVDDHPRAERQYKTLSKFENVPQPLYYPVPSGDPAAFASQVGSLADALIRQVNEAKSAVEKPSDTAEKKPAKTLTLEDSAQLIGRAMALRHLGRAKGQEAPAMFRAWSSDRDFANQRVFAFSVRALLSKNQLSDLVKTLSATVEALEAGQIEPDDLFNQLRSAALAAGRDPDQINQGGARNMEEAGLVGEYLDGLPYESRLMTLSEGDWLAMGVGQQQEIIDEARARIRLYRKWAEDPDRWIALHDGADPGDYVYPVPLDALP